MTSTVAAAAATASGGGGGAAVRQSKSQWDTPGVAAGAAVVSNVPRKGVPTRSPRGPPVPTTSRHAPTATASTPRGGSGAGRDEGGQARGADKGAFPSTRPFTATSKFPRTSIHASPSRFDAPATASAKASSPAAVLVVPTTLGTPPVSIISTLSATTSTPFIPATPAPSVSAAIEESKAVAPRIEMPDRNRVATGGTREKLGKDALEEKMRTMKLKNEQAEARHRAMKAEAESEALIEAAELAETERILEAERVESERIWESQREAREAQAVADALAALELEKEKKLLEKEKTRLRKLEIVKRKEKDQRTMELQASINAERQLAAERKLTQVQTRAWDREKTDAALPPSLSLSLKKTASKHDDATNNEEKELNYPSVEASRQRELDRENGVVFVQGVKEESGWDTVEQDHEESLELDEGSGNATEAMEQKDTPSDAEVVPSGVADQSEGKESAETRVELQQE